MGWHSVALKATCLFVSFLPRLPWFYLSHPYYLNLGNKSSDFNSLNRIIWASIMLIYYNSIFLLLYDNFDDSLSFLSLTLSNLGIFFENPHWTQFGNVFFYSPRTDSFMISHSFSRNWGVGNNQVDDFLSSLSYTSLIFRYLSELFSLSPNFFRLHRTFSPNLLRLQGTFEGTFIVYRVLFEGHRFPLVLLKTVFTSVKRDFSIVKMVFAATNESFTQWKFHFHAQIVFFWFH